MYELLKSTEVVISIIIALFGSGWGLIAWFQRRSEKRAEGIKADIAKSASDDRSRIGRVEAEVKRIDGALIDLDGRVETGFRDVDERFHGIERRLDAVASKEDVNELKLAGARSESRMETLVRNDGELKEMIHRQGEAFSKLAATVVEKVTR